MAESKDWEESPDIPKTSRKRKREDEPVPEMQLPEMCLICKKERHPLYNCMSCRTPHCTEHIINCQSKRAQHCCFGHCTDCFESEVCYECDSPRKRICWLVADRCEECNTRVCNLHHTKRCISCGREVCSVCRMLQSEYKPDPTLFPDGHPPICDYITTEYPNDVLCLKCVKNAGQESDSMCDICKRAGEIVSEHEPGARSKWIEMNPGSVLDDKYVLAYRCKRCKEVGILGCCIRPCSTCDNVFCPACRKQCLRCLKWSCVEKCEEKAALETLPIGLH